MKKKIENLIETIEENIESVSSDRKSVEEIKLRLQEHGITEGRIERILSDPNLLEDADLREVALLTEQFFVKTGLLVLDPKEWFTESEMTEARQFDRGAFDITEEATPFELENVIVAGNGIYLTVITPRLIAELMGDQVLYYNHEIQRQATFEKRNKQIIKTPTVNRKNIREMTELLLKNRLESTTIALNAAIGSSKDDEEFTFNSNLNTLTVNKGTRLDILDGYHRCLASVEAYQKNKELGDFKFILRLSNYTTREAQQYQAQLAKATPIPKARQQELAAERLADTVVQHLRADSEIGEYISSQHRISPTAGELVSYNVFADAVEREFPMKVRLEARKVSRWLGEFFEYLIGMNPEEFVFNSKKDSSMMSYNKMFSGYIALAARMQQEGIEIDKLQSIMQSIDFSKDNPLWQELGILDKNKKIKSTANERTIAKYFKELEILESIK